MRAGAGEQLAGKGIVGFFALMEGRITENIIIAAADAGQPITGDHLGFQPQPGTVQAGAVQGKGVRSEEHTSELQSRENLVCRLLLEKKKLTIKKRCVGGEQLLVDIYVGFIMIS